MSDVFSVYFHTGKDVQHTHTHTILLTFTVTLLLRISFGLRSPFSTLMSLLRGALSFSARLRARSVFHERDFLLCQNIKFHHIKPTYTGGNANLTARKSNLKCLRGKIHSCKTLDTVNLFLTLAKCIEYLSSISISRDLRKYKYFNTLCFSITQV